MQLDDVGDGSELDITVAIISYQTTMGDQSQCCRNPA
jgi:hypothetical protein